MTSASCAPDFMSESDPSQMVPYSASEAGGFHDMNRAIRALASTKDSAASAAVKDLIVSRADSIEIRDKSPNRTIRDGSFEKLSMDFRRQSNVVRAAQIDQRDSNMVASAISLPRCLVGEFLLALCAESLPPENPSE